MAKYTLLLLFMLPEVLFGQDRILTGNVVDESSRQPLPGAVLTFPETGTVIQANDSGFFQISVAAATPARAVVSAAGYLTDTLLFPDSDTITLSLRQASLLEEVTVSGTVQPVKRAASAIPTEIYSASFFRKNPTPSLFEALTMASGVRPQLNCNVCNTGDIHINGMEGPYTLILIDGMPIVSSLSTVYGLSGIPNSIIEKVEVVKGPAEAMYSSEAMGGMINVTTRQPGNMPQLSADVMASSWREVNTDLMFKAKPHRNIQTLLGINYFNYQHPLDKNHDGFTDVTLQNRVSVFNKWSFSRRQHRQASLAARYVYEDRWGGQMNWSRQWRGSDSIYGESIFTSRWELLGVYQLPLRPRIYSQVSVIGHNQDSYYGTVSFQGNQKVAFAQLYWEAFPKSHHITAGISSRATFYNDNTPATADERGNDRPDNTTLTGLFLQDEWRLHPRHLLYAGYRLDYDPRLHFIHSPRIAYKWRTDASGNLRASFGKGFRVVNIFTEDHAALTGARKVEIEEALKPEESYNGSISYTHTLSLGKGFINLDALAFYTYFTNKIVPDYDTDPDKILYRNLHGHAVSRGLTLNAEAIFSFPLSMRLGLNYLNVYQVFGTNAAPEHSEQLFAPEWSGSFTLSYLFPGNISVDLTGQVNGPMRLPVQPNDYRPEYSPPFCLANVQCSRKFGDRWELYAGIKNLLNFVPQNVYMRPFDPFDKTASDRVQNPNGYTFDTSYNYAPLQGIRTYAGLRYALR